MTNDKREMSLYYVDFIGDLLYTRRPTRLPRCDKINHVAIKLIRMLAVSESVRRY